MSTRATILVKSERWNEELRVYHHSDGYPDGIGSDMKAYLSKIDYWDVAEITNDLIKGYCADDNGYEITISQHGDEEYAYVIDCDNETLKCYSIGMDDTDWPKDEKEEEIPD